MIDLLPSLMLSHRVVNGAMVMKADPDSGSGRAFEDDLRALAHPTPPYLQVLERNFDSASLTVRLPAMKAVQLKPLLAALKSPDARAAVLMAFALTVRKLEPVSELSLAGVLLDVEGRFHLTPPVKGLVDYVAGTMFWEGREYKNYCVTSEPGRIPSSLRNVVASVWATALPLGTSMPALAPLDRFTVADASFWEAVQVLDDQFKTTQPPVGELVMQTASSLHGFERWDPA